MNDVLDNLNHSSSLDEHSYYIYWFNIQDEESMFMVFLHDHYWLVHNRLHHLKNVTHHH